jgi:hypothetical protein
LRSCVGGGNWRIVLIHASGNRFGFATHLRFRWNGFPCLSEDDQLLIWFPEYAAFGQWDAEHWKAYQFPGVSWEQIIADPTRWLNEMYGPAEQRAVLIRPWRNPQAKFKTYEELRREPEIEQTPLTEEMFAASACVKVQNAIFGGLDEAAAALAEIANVESRESVLPRLKLLADEVTDHRAQLEGMVAAGLSELDNRLLTKNAFRGGGGLDRIRDNWLRIKESGLATEQLKTILAEFSPYAVR